MSGHLLESGHYELCVKVIEGRHLAWLNMDPIACVQVGKEKRYTRVCDNTDCPYFNEFFVFDFRTSLTELLEKTITLSVLADRGPLRRRKLLGLTRLDVATVWKQPEHQFYQKWAALEDPGSPTAGSRGFLRVSLSVAASGRAPPPPQLTPEDDDIEGQLLGGKAGSGRERARYEVSVFRGDGLWRSPPLLMQMVACASPRDPPSPYVQVAFAGLSARTRTFRESRSPEWNERLVFYDLLPPMWQRARLQVRHEDSVLATAYIDLGAVSSPGHDGFLPTFGPAYVFLYGGEAAYRGRLLVSLRTVPDAEVTTGGTAVHPLPPLDEEELWQMEEHSLFAVLLGADCIPRALSGKALVLQVAMGDQGGDGLASIPTQLQRDAPLESVVTESAAPGATISPPLRAAPYGDGDAYCRLRLGARKPCAALRRRWPNFHTRMALSNALAALAASLESVLSELERGKNRPTAGGDADQVPTLVNLGAKLREDATKLLTAADIWAAAYTPLDIHRASRCKKLVDNVRNLAVVWESGGQILGADDALSKGNLLLVDLRDAIEDPQPALPDVVVRLAQSGGRSLGYARLKARDLFYTEQTHVRGTMCGVVSTLILQSGEREGCEVPGAVTLLLWLGASRDVPACLRALPPGCDFLHEAPLSLPATLTCTQQQTLLGLAHVYGGRFFPGDDESGLCDPFVRVTIAGGHTLDTEVQFGKLDPVWDQTLVFEDVLVTCSSGKYIRKHPPLVIVEVLDLDKNVVGQRREEAMGRAVTSAAVRLQGEPHRAPALRWLPVHRADAHVGDVLFSAEVLQVGPKETSLVEMWPSPEGIVPIPAEIRPRLISYKLEAVFWGVRRLRRVCLLAVSRPRVSLDVAGRRLCSAVIPNTAANPNFPSPHMVFTLDLPEQKEYLPPLLVEVHDCRSFGREVLAGVHAIHSLVDFVVPTPPYLTDRQLAEIQQGLSGDEDAEDTPAVAVKKEIRKTIIAVRHSVSEDVPVAAGTYKKGKKNLWGFFRQRDPPLDDKEKLLQEIQESKESKESKGDKREQKQDKAEGGAKARRRLGAMWRRKHVAPTTAEEEIEALDWWTKYYASLPQAERDRKLSLAGQKGAEDATEGTEPPEKLELYPCELEKLAQFSGLQDWLRCFPLHRGKRAASGTSPVVGYVKAALCLYPSPVAERRAARVLSRHGHNAPVRVLVRCYCVRATQLHPRDPSGLSDPYVEMRAAGQVAGSRDDYIPQQLDPIFGRVLQLECVLPRDWQVTVRVMDWDRTTRDDLIGETRLDLEQRLYSDHRAHCGLPRSYHTKGYNAWRDAERPTQILEGLCSKRGLDPPEYLDDHTLMVAGATYTLPLVDLIKAERRRSESREQLALQALHGWRPRLVAEHVERRTLLHAAHPGLPQGFLHLWVDLFPLPSAATLPPPPVDISPRKPRELELRVIVVGTEDVLLDEKDFFGGGRCSDVYVKGWVPEQKAQCTDVHYRSLDGEAMFNWRFVFPLRYLPGERRLVVRQRSGPLLGRAARRTAPPRLYLQVWDCDHFSPDDFLGAVTLNLWQLPVGAPSAKQCSLAMLERGAPVLNLFRARRAHGWWPFRGREGDDYIIAGKVELVLEVLTQLEAEAKPAGKGRNPPDALEKPNRPDTSFSFFANPLRALYFGVWRPNRLRVLACLLTILGVFFVLVALYSFPEYTVKRLLGA